MMHRLAWIVAALSLFISVPAFTAPGTKVKISDLNDLDLGNWNFSSMTGNDPVCVYRNDGTNTYQVMATDDSTIAPASFALENTGRTAQIPYALYWSNTAAPGTTQLNDGVNSAASGADTSSSNCSGGDTANFKVSINNSDLAAVPSGTYTATVSLTIQP